jgi:hypothetical protein
LAGGGSPAVIFGGGVMWRAAGANAGELSGAARLGSAGELEGAARFAREQGRGAWRLAGGEEEARERRNGD